MKYYITLMNTKTFSNLSSSIYLLFILEYSINLAFIIIIIIFFFFFYKFHAD